MTVQELFVCAFFDSTIEKYSKQQYKIKKQKTLAKSDKITIMETGNKIIYWGVKQWSWL